MPLIQTCWRSYPHYIHTIPSSSQFLLQTCRSQEHIWEKQNIIFDFNGYLSLNMMRQNIYSGPIFFSNINREHEAFVFQPLVGVNLSAWTAVAQFQVGQGPDWCIRGLLGEDQSWQDGGMVRGSTGALQRPAGNLALCLPTVKLLWRPTTFPPLGLFSVFFFH